MVAKAITKAGARAAGKKLVKKKRSDTKELERKLDLEKAKRGMKKLRAETRAKEAAEKKKVKKKASTQNLLRLKIHFYSQNGMLLHGKIN